MFFEKKDVHLGLAAEQESGKRLRNSKTLDSINKFTKYVLTLLEKFFARSSMKSTIVRNVCFQPETNDL